MRPEIVLQPHLGRVFQNYKPQDNMGGYMALGRIMEVHHKLNTVDLMILRTGDVITSDIGNEGRFGARVSTSSAHYNEELGVTSGSMEPLMKGQLVLLAFLDGNKGQPVIIGSMHDSWSGERNMLPEAYPLEINDFYQAAREANKWLKIFPSQFYAKVDGAGAVEVSHPSGTFMIMDPDIEGKIKDDHDAYGHNDLSVNSYNSNDTIRGTDHSSLIPVKTMFAHRSYLGSYESGLYSWTKFFLDSNGLFRVTRDYNDEKLTYIELGKTGDYTIRRQNDSNVRGEGTDHTTESLSDTGDKTIVRHKDNIEVSIKIDGETPILTINRTGEDGSTSVVIDENNEITLTHQSGSYIKMTNDGDIIIKAHRNILLNND